MSQQLFRFSSACGLAPLAALMLVSDSSAQVVFDNGGPNILDMPTGAPPVAIEVRDSAGGSPTSLDVVAGAEIGGGSGRSVGLFGQSIFSMSGGSAPGDLFITDTAQATLSGGTFGDDGVVEESGLLILLPGGSIGDDLTVRGAGRLEMSGGELPDEVFIEQSATALFTGGVIGDDLNPGGNAVVIVNFVTLEDSVDAFGSSLTNIFGGLIEGSISALDSSVVNIAGGDFPNVFSGGEEIVASSPGATISITGGNFGEVGGTDGGAVLASQGGKVSFSNATIAGTAGGNAPLATFSAVLNGQVDLFDAQFGALALEAGNSGKLNVDQIMADEIEAHSLAGGQVNLNGGSANSLNAFVELGGILNLRGGQFGSTNITLETDSRLTVFGNSFAFLGMPVESLPADAYVPETGELRFVGGDLTGVLSDSTPFSLTYSRQAVFGARVFLVRIPEPTSAALAVVLVVGCGVGRVIGQRKNRIRCEFSLQSH